MINFTYHNPTKIIFGKGALSGLAREAGKLGKKALLVYGKGSLKKNGVLKTITDSLSGAGIETVEFGGAQPNPTVSHAEAGIKAAKENKVDFIIAAGGGSAMDTAKAIAAGAQSAAPLWDFLSGKEPVKAALPLLTIVTMPATASEMNGIMVLTNDLQDNMKSGIGSPFLYPRVSFLDPELTFSVPVQATAYACSDIMSHVLESYFTNTDTFTPVQDGYAEGIVKAVIESMDRIIKNPADYDGRASFMWSATLAWNGLGHAGVNGAAAPCHMMEYPLSGLYGLTHGAGLSVIIPAFLKFSENTRRERILKFGTNILGLDPEELRVSHVIETLTSYYRRIGTPANFREAGIKNPDLNLMAEQAFANMRTRGVTGYEKADILKIYALCS